MKRSYLIAGGLALAVIIWVGSGQLERPTPGQFSEDDADNAGVNEPVMLVEAREMEAERITSMITAQGNLEPNRSVVVNAEVAGQVEEIMVREGQPVKADEPILKLEMDDRAIRREQAELRIEQRERSYEANQDLVEQGFVSQTELDTSLVELKMAEVELAQIELEIEKTTIRAPFDGILEQRNVELGDFVSVGNEVATVVDNDPLVVNARVPQHSVHEVEEGETVRVDLISGKQVEGTVRFISSQGNQATRTFRVEVEIANDQGLRAGSSATAHIPTREIEAHFISGALLSLNEDGEMGVKTVDRNGLVSFHPVSIELSEPDGVWVSGLPTRARVITTGQGFARVGARVMVADEQSPAEAVSKRSAASDAKEI